MTFLLLPLAAAMFFAAGAVGEANAATQYGKYTIYTTNELCKLTVSPKEAAAQVGTQQTFTATVTAIGPQMPVAEFGISYSDTFNACGYKQLGDLEGLTVSFKIVSGPNAGKTENVALGAGAAASFTFTSASAGADVVEASLTLPDICFIPYIAPSDSSTQALPAACEGMFGPQAQALSITQCDDLQALAPTSYNCPTVTLRGAAQVTWSAPTVTAQGADPTLTFARFKRCVTGPFKISPTYSGGAIKSSTLIVDGKRKRTQSGSEPFSISARSYKAGKHNFEIVTIFASGKAASKFGSFTRCSARVTVKRVSPKFAG